MDNWRETILSQYDNSERLLALVAAMNAAIDPAADIAAFHAAVFDPETAFGWGLDVWGRIVAIPRTLEVEATNIRPFGFAGSDLSNFGHGPFAYESKSNTFVLQDNAYRLLIWMKAASNVTDGSLPDLNRIVHRLFSERGHIAVVHVGTMKIRYVIGFRLQPYERALLLRDDVPPKPAGVGYDLYQVIPKHNWGFAGSGGKNFNHGVFQPYGGPADAYSIDSQHHA